MHCKACIVTEDRIFKKQIHLSIIYLIVCTSCTVTTYIYVLQILHTKFIRILKEQNTQRKNLNLVNPYKGIILFPYIHASVCSVYK